MEGKVKNWKSRKEKEKTHKRLQNACDKNVQSSRDIYTNENGHNDREK